MASAPASEEGHGHPKIALRDGAGQNGIASDVASEEVDGVSQNKGKASGNRAAAQCAASGWGAAPDTGNEMDGKQKA